MHSMSFGVSCLKKSYSKCQRLYITVKLYLELDSLGLSYLIPIDMCINILRTLLKNH